MNQVAEAIWSVAGVIASTAAFALAIAIPQWGLPPSLWLLVAIHVFWSLILWSEADKVSRR